ncbi:unnamed protein product [Closterium sp. NIES-53]
MVKPVIEHPPPVMLETKAGEGLQAVAATVKANPSVMLLDSRCSHHLVGDRSAFVEMSSGGGIKHVIGFNGAPQEVQGRGTVALLGDGGRRVLVPDVLYVPGVQARLLSAGQLCDSGVQLLDAGDVTLLRAPDGSLLGHAEFKGRVFCTNFQPCSTQQQEGEAVALRTLATGVQSKVDKWHARLAHVGVDAIERTAAHGSVTGFELEKGGKSGMPCVSCVGGNITRHTFPSVGEEEDELLGVVHADLCGPFREAANDGSRYLLVLKDRKMRYVWAYPLAKKSDALAAFQKWFPMAERQCKTTVKALHTDQGGKFLGHDFTLFLDEKGIIHDLTCPYMLEQNGMQEHGGRPMLYEPLPSLFPGTLEEVEEEEVVAPPAMPYVPTSVPTPPPPTVYPRVVPPTTFRPSSPPLATPPPPVIPSPLPPSILPAPAPPSSSSSTAPPVGEGGTVVLLSVMITDGQRLVTEQLQDKSSMDGVQQSGGQEIGEQQTGEQQIGE